MYPFGLDREKLVLALRELADKFESERCLPQTVMTLTTARHDDYAINRVIITFVEKN